MYLLKNKMLSDIANKILMDEDVSFGLGNEVTIEKEVGKGSYGSVYSAIDNNGKKVAVKCCNIRNNTGIPSILETSIMSSYLHPYLNSAYKITANNTMLYIIQDLAQRDMAEHTRRRPNKEYLLQNISTLKDWCFSIASAVSVLHKDNIIHADIKASNVLVYKDNSVKLTDFTLSLMKPSPEKKFKHNVCTSTHKPLECFINQEWDESLDIWALGCTFYEIAYGDLLFPYQGSVDKSLSSYRNLDPVKRKEKEREAKNLIKNKYINAIIDWANRSNPSKKLYSEFFNPNIDYMSFSLVKEFYFPEMRLFNDLLLKMLVVDPSSRLTISQIIHHPFFEQKKLPIYLSIVRPIKTLPFPEEARIITHIQRFTKNTSIQQLAMLIYCRCTDLDIISESILAETSVLISSKILYGIIPKTILNMDDVLRTEKLICHNLRFSLHLK